MDLVSSDLPAGVGLWALVNNAGIYGPVAPLEMVTRTQMAHVFNFNTVGMSQVTHWTDHMILTEKKYQKFLFFLPSISGIDNPSDHMSEVKVKIIQPT